MRGKDAREEKVTHWDVGKEGSGLYACSPLGTEFVKDADCDDGDSCNGVESCSEGACFSGEPLVCEDGNPCTSDDCSGLTGCVFEDITGPCDDGSACTNGDGCIGGTCVGGVPLSCDDSDLCTVDSCSPEVGCVNEAIPEGEACDDGDACTGCAPGDSDCSQFDYCSAGQCASGLGKPCECEVSEDCLPLDDGNICNGGWVCNEGTCEIDPATVVDCSGQEAPVCGAIACNPNTGACEVVDGENGVPCDDGNVCTDGDSCMDGECAAGETNVCGCEANEDCGQFDDGDACNGVWTCQEGSCAFDDTTILGDSDGDGVCDDADMCNGDDASGDSDSDMTCDDIDACDDDAAKTEEGACGCGVADTDTDEDGTADRRDEGGGRAVVDYGRGRDL